MLKTEKLKALREECLEYIKGKIDELGEIHIDIVDEFGNPEKAILNSNYSLSARFEFIPDISLINVIRAAEICDAIHLKPLENFNSGKL